MKEQLMQYWNAIIFLVPLGIVGVWRWSVWLIKKSISFFYQVPSGDFFSTLAIVTPVYNEDPEMFRLALESWKLNQPDEIVAVIDHTNPELIEIFKNFALNFAGAKLIITPKPGKREALADGIRATKSEIIALVDSDTIWDYNIKIKLLAPFVDEKVGGLTTRQDVLEVNTLARKLFKILLDERYLLEYPFLATVSSALLCLSGRTAVYRRKAIIDKLHDLVEEKFWGQQMISGDDKTLTNLVQIAGWKTVFLRNVKVYTPGAPKVLAFLQQKLRWARNGLRSDSKLLLSGWIWKNHKVLALYMLDKFIAPLTLLLGPVYLGVAVYFGHWKIAAIILGWWLMSRMIKIFPHLKEKPRDVFILPTYVVLTYVIAVVKIYAFFTLDKQGWITRWDAGRLRSLGLFRQLTALLLTVFFVGSYFAVIKSYYKQNLSKPTARTEIKNVPKVISEEPRSISNVALAQKKENILSKKNDAYGFYAILPGDTLSVLQKKFNLNSIASIMYAGKFTIGDVNSIAVGEKIMIPVAELRNPLNADTIVKNQFGKRLSIISFDRATNTIYTKGGGSVVTLSKIREALPNDKQLLEEQKTGEWILRANLYVGDNVTLVLDKKEVSFLKLKSDMTGFVWIRSQGGNILISNTKISSWNEAMKTPDLEYTDGRSFIVAKSSGRMDVVNSEISFLGYEGLPRRGGPFGGSYGLSWKITSGSFGKNLLTGSIINSSIHHNYFGIYTFGATGVVIKNNEVFSNIQYGIDPHDDSNNLLITENNSYGNGNHGIIISKRCFNNEISRNFSHDNKLHGIMLDRKSNNNIVQNNEIFGNEDGVVIYDSNDNIIAQNNIYQNMQGIRLNQKSSSNYIEGNQISSNKNGIHVYGEANENIFLENSVTSNVVGISIQDAYRNSFYGSLNYSENKKDVYITINSNENEIKR